MFVFNLKGFLIPESIIPCTIEEFEYEFAIKTNDNHIIQLFDNYKLYCKDLKTLCGNRNIRQWVDGSYVTLSKNPSDIDLVVFLDHETIKMHETELKKFQYPQSLAEYGIDAYMIVVYPRDSDLTKSITNADMAYWIDLFGKTKHNRQMRRIPKGFLEINI